MTNKQIRRGTHITSDFDIPYILAFLELSSVNPSPMQMGFEHATLRVVAECSNHWATGDSMVNKGQLVGLDWNRIARLHSQVMNGTHELTDIIARSH